MKIVLVVMMMYAVLCFVTDIRSRQMYSLPANVLGVIIVILGEILKGTVDIRLIVIMVVSFIVFRLMSKFGVWGEGDSDYLFMLTQLIASISVDYGILVFAVAELIIIAVSLILSVLIAFIETKIKKEKFEKRFRAAALPGFCMVTEALCVVAWRIYE